MLFETQNQGLIFIATFIISFLVAILCEIVHFFSNKTKHKIVTFCINFLFSTFACVIFYALCLWLNYGEIRLYLVLTYVAGIFCGSLGFAKLKKTLLRKKLKNFIKKEKEM